MNGIMCLLLLLSLLSTNEGAFVWLVRSFVFSLFVCSVRFQFSVLYCRFWLLSHCRCVTVGIGGVCAGALVCICRLDILYMRNIVVVDFVYNFLHWTGVQWEPYSTDFNVSLFSDITISAVVYCVR